MAVDPDNAGASHYGSADTLRILFVDDDPILREFASVNLSAEHVVVETSPGGAPALTALESGVADILLLDLETPSSDGLGALRRIRADPRYASLPVIVVTGREDVDMVDQAFEAGATSFVVKPLNWRLLGRQLRYVRRAARPEQTPAARDEGLERLHELAAEGARFIAQALSHDPALGPAALSFARIADAALKPPPHSENREVEAA